MNVHNRNQKTFEERLTQACRAVEACIELEAAAVEMLREHVGGPFDAAVYDAIGALRRARAAMEVAAMGGAS